MRYAITLLVGITLIACESGPQRGRGDASGTVTSDAASLESDQDIIDELPPEGPHGGPCVRVDEGWGCTDPEQECIRGWCQKPFTSEGIRCREVPSGQP
ncbi:MAG: hypothetical protein IV100_04025 [Myxococcales bacterium]|nr:hypothetical protein [Myxococcales bacterium]